MQCLERSLEAGFAEQQLLETDTDLDSLRSHPRFAELTGLNPPPQPDRVKQWHYDLDFFARRMRQMHWELFAKVAEEDFYSELKRLKSDVPALEDHQVVMRLARIVASVGDGHTLLRTAPDHASGDVPVLPVRFYQFSDGLHVIAADGEHEELVGARVLRIGSLDAGAAFEAAKPYISVDNEIGYQDQVPIRLRLPWLLKAIGAIDDVDQLELEVELREGGRKTASLTPRPMGPTSAHGNVELRPRRDEHFAGPEDQTRPLYLQERDGPIWREHLPERKLVYVHFGAIANPTNSTLGDFAEELTELVESRDDAEYVVLDMRFNGGGNTGLVLPLIHALVRSEELGTPGRLFVITGRRTFSAAMNTTSQLEIHTAATFVGEPTGSSPNFVGESTWFVLPYHKNRVFCSSRYWQFISSTDKRRWISPQLPAPLSFADFAAGRDPAMEAIFAAIAAGWPESKPVPIESARRQAVE